ncbi:MAG: aminotransferase class I/II-fold pyridoxal phosphate-dependent enzyme [Lawsonella sp.]
MRHDRARNHVGQCLDLASNDYLNMSQHPDVIAAASRVLHKWGTGARSSRVVTGTHPAHHEFESTLSRYLQAPAALVFSSGYTANMAAITAFSSSTTQLICDRRNHASLIDACRLTGARKTIIDVADRQELRNTLARFSDEQTLVVCDAVDSVTGETLDAAAIYAETHRAGALLIVDNAHGLGVWGDDGAGPFPELFSSKEYRTAQDLIVTCTLSKALGAQGGAIVCSPQQRQHLVDTARTFIFDTALAPVMAAAAATSLKIICETPHILKELHGTVDILAEKLRMRGVDIRANHSDAAAPIIYVPLGNPEKARGTVETIEKEGILVGCFTPPSVKWQESGMRLTLHRKLSLEHIDFVADTIALALN